MGSFFHQQQTNRARLLLLSDFGSVIQEFDINNIGVVLGRGSESNIILTGMEVSRTHAQIICNSSGYYISDLESTNGTYLNGKKISSRKLVRLDSNDNLIIGNFKLIFQIVPASVPLVTVTNSNNTSNNIYAKKYAQEEALVGAGLKNNNTGSRLISRLYDQGQEQDINNLALRNIENNTSQVLDALNNNFQEDQINLMQSVYEEKLRLKNRILKSLKERLDKYSRLPETDWKTSETNFPEPLEEVDPEKFINNKNNSSFISNSAVAENPEENKIETQETKQEIKSDYEDALSKLTYSEEQDKEKSQSEPVFSKQKLSDIKDITENLTNSLKTGLTENLFSMALSDNKNKYIYLYSLVLIALGVCSSIYFYIQNSPAFN